jgi:hypothetical protein
VILGSGQRLVVTLLFGLGLLLLVLVAVPGADAANPVEALARFLVRLAGTALAVVPLLPTGLLLHRHRQALRPGGPDFPEVLRARLGLGHLAESQGVQFAAVPYPDQARPPSQVVLAFFLQNCHDTPRTVEVEIDGGRLGWPERTRRAGVELAPGEAGVLKLVATVEAGTGEGEAVAPYRLRVAMPAGAGRRAIRSGPGRLVSFGRGKLSVGVLAPAGDAGPGPVGIAHPFQVGQEGYAELYRPGQRAVNEDALRFLAFHP